MYEAAFEAMVVDAVSALPRDDGVVAAVRAVLTPTLDGACSLTTTARALGVSERTLQRRLREEGESFATVLDGVRRETSARLLAEGLTLAEVAARLGYAEASAFHRAHRRWTGTTPERARADRREE